MPVTLAMAAIDRSISAHRITKVRPTAMTPVTEIWVRMLPRLSSVANEGLAAAKKPNRQISVRNGAILRIWERSTTASPRGRFRSAGTVTLSPVVMSVSSRRFQQAVFADLFVGKLPDHRAALEHDDAVGERQHRLRLGGEHDDGESLGAEIPDDVDDVVLGADIHAAGRLAQHQQPRRIAQPLCQRHLLLIAAGEHAELDIDGRGPDPQLLDLPGRDRALACRLEQQGRNAIEDTDRDVLVDRLLQEQHVASAFGNEGDPGTPGVRRAAEGLMLACDRERAEVGLYLAEQDPRQFELPASHETVDAEHLAGAGLERDLAQAAGQR